MPSLTSKISLGALRSLFGRPSVKKQRTRKTGQLANRQVAQSKEPHASHTPFQLQNRQITQSLIKKKSRNLFSRKPSSKVSQANLLPQAGRVPEKDGIMMAAIPKNSSAQNILHFVWKTASNSLISTNQAYDYQKIFYEKFKEVVTNMSDEELTDLYQNMNTPEMQSVRGGLPYDGKPNTIFTKKEIASEIIHVGQHLQVVDNMIIAELKSRQDDGEIPPSLSNNEAKQVKNKQAQNAGETALKNLNQWMTDETTAESGHVNESLKRRMEGEFISLCKQGEGVEEGNNSLTPARVNMNDNTSEKLNVSEDYIDNFNKTEKTFIANDITTHARELEYRADLANGRVDISNHLTQFCKNNANQAERLNVLLTPEATEPILSAIQNGILGTHPQASFEDAKPQLLGPSNTRFIIKREKGGNITLAMSITLYPQTYEAVQGDDDGNNANWTNHAITRDIDERKSFILANVRVSVPPEENAPPTILSFTHHTRIAERESPPGQPPN